MNLYYSYDNAGFESALKDGADEIYNASHTIDEQLFEILIYCNHDLLKGFCNSFQIYNEDGSIRFNSEMKEAA